jgi:hypothetical protein
MDYFYLTLDSKEEGPIDEDILISRAKSGIITPETPVRNGMVKSYKLANKVTCLKGKFGVSATPQTGPVPTSKQTKNLHRSKSSITTPSTNYRFMAFFLDTLVIAVLVILNFNLLKSLGGDQETMMSLFLASVPVTPIAYYAFTLGIKAQSFGFWVFGIMIIKGEGKEVYVGRAFLMASLFTLTIPLAPIFIFIFTKGLHESLTNTRVVNVRMG